MIKIPDHTIVRPVYLPERISGACMKKGDTWCIGYRQDIEGFRRDRVVAHELGHLEDDTCGIEHYFAERRADEFARQILVSEEELRSCLSDGFTTISELQLFFPSATPEMIERSCRLLPIHTF